MSIRIKLIISYLAALVVPIFLTLIAAVVILGIYAGGIPRKEFGPDFFKSFTQKASSVYFELEQAITENPDKLLDVKYLEQLDEKLIIMNTGIVVYKDNQLIYASKFLNSTDIMAKLSKPISNARESRGKNLHDMVFANNKTYNVIRNEFVFSSKAAGKLFALTDVSPIGEFARKYFSALAFAILFILLLTNAILTYIVSRSILRPLSLLKHGTRQIKEGNLNFEVKTKSKDEIGQVCLAFDEMRQRLKDSLETQLQYEENRKELLSSISHDLKTPVTAIKGYVEGIMDGVADTPEKVEKYISTINAKATALDRLIDDLFLFSKLDLKKLPFNFEKVDIKKYFEDCIEELKFDMDKKNILLEFNADFNKTIKVVADREKLKRVIVNIIENAAKNMNKENSRISIKLCETAEMVEIAVEDNGQGINCDELPFIFDRFYRADQSRNTATGGSGLGLAIARQIIGEHGGVIWAESCLGIGTTIYFTLKKVPPGV